MLASKNCIIQDYIPVKPHINLEFQPSPIIQHTLHMLSLPALAKPNAKTKTTKIRLIVVFLYDCPEITKNALSPDDAAYFVSKFRKL